jgi:hypothetical protein
MGITDVPKVGAPSLRLARPPSRTIGSLAPTGLVAACIARSTWVEPEAAITEVDWFRPTSEWSAPFRPRLESPTDSKTNESSRVADDGSATVKECVLNAKGG